MLKISKLADYATTVMVELARQPEQAKTAKDIAYSTHLTLPTVSKLLKSLARAGLLVSQRGAKGGYALAMPANEISIAHIITVLDGNIAITECNHTRDLCSLQSACSTRRHWNVINQAIQGALENMSLAEMAKPIPIKFWRNKQDVLTH